MRKPQLFDILHDALRGALATVHTSIPGVVESYDADAQTADVVLSVRFSRRDPDTGERVPYDAPPLPNVPILWPAGGGGEFSDTWPLERGDELWVQFAERSIDEWVINGEDVVTPVSVRRFSLSDAVAVPAKSSRGESLPADAIDAAARVIRAPELKLGSASADDFVALASLVKSELDDISNKLNYLLAIAQTSLTGGGIPMVAVTPAPPLDGTPYVPGDVAASKVKAE